MKGREKLLGRTCEVRISQFEREVKFCRKVLKSVTTVAFKTLALFCHLKRVLRFVDIST
jgi:hypothetical protein